MVNVKPKAYQRGKDWEFDSLISLTTYVICILLFAHNWFGKQYQLIMLAVKNNLALFY